MEIKLSVEMLELINSQTAEPDLARLPPDELINVIEDMIEDGEITLIESKIIYHDLGVSPLKPA